MTPRPKRHSQEVIQKAAALLAPKFKKWVDSEDDDDTPLAELEKDLIDAIKYEDDGYAIARKLDGRYDPDAELVEILCEAEILKRMALSDLEAGWVIANKLQGPPIGAKVASKSRGMSGIVCRNYPDGKSCITRDSDRPGCGPIIEWENLTIIELPPDVSPGGNVTCGA